MQVYSSKFMGEVNMRGRGLGRAVRVGEGVGVRVVWK